MSYAYQLRHLEVWHGKQCTLAIPELTLKQGDCYALLGDNGAGKSTLLDHLALLALPVQGELYINDDKVGKPILPKLRNQIGYVSQQPFFLDGSVYDNLVLSLKLRGIARAQHAQLIAKALTTVNLTALSQHIAYQLSGGELKRAAIARAIVHDPDIILLDEPFSHLDQQHIQQLEHIITGFNNETNKTIIFSTHDRLQGAALADKTINLIKGRLTDSPLLNLFHGQLKDNYFHTRHLRIATTSTQYNASHLAIAPHDIIVSNQPILSSMQNQFSGRLIAISEEEQVIQLTIDCQERFYATINPLSLRQLGLTIGQTLYLSFKSTAVNLF